MSRRRRVVVVNVSCVVVVLVWMRVSRRVRVRVCFLGVGGGREVVVCDVVACGQWNREIFDDGVGGVQQRPKMWNRGVRWGQEEGEGKRGSRVRRGEMCAVVVMAAASAKASASSA